jgi:hypothetical protein
VFGIHVLNSEGMHVFGFNRSLELPDGTPDRMAAGQRARIAGTVENPLVPGRYSVNCWITRNRNQGDVALQLVRLADFVVYGTKPGPGVVSVRSDVEAVLEPEA